MFQRVQEAWRVLFVYKNQHLSDKERMTAAKTAKNDYRIDATNEEDIEGIREVLLEDHVLGNNDPCPWPDICSHNILINSVIELLKEQGQELKKLRESNG